MLAVDVDAVLGVTGAAYFLPENLIGITEVGRNIALIAVPFVIWFLTKSGEKRRATLDIVRTSDHEVRAYLERLYTHRKHQEGVAKGLSQTPDDPYEKVPALFNFDSVRVLNFYEGICTEIDLNALDEDILYKTIRNTIMGAHEIVLTRYSDRVGTDQSADFEHLVKIAKRWRARAKPYDEVGGTRIPGD